MIMYQTLLESLESNTVVLTANRRLSALLQQQFNERQKQKTWQTPKILPLKTWLVNQWHCQINSHTIVCDDNQASLLWRKIIQDDAEAARLLQVNQTTKWIKQAWETLTLWQIEQNELSQYSTDETQKFMEWAKKFEQLKHSKNRVCWVELPALLKVEQGNIELPKNLVLVGFAELPPALRTFFTAIEHRTQVKYFTPVCQNQSQQRIALKNSEHEIKMMAQWAQQQLIEGKQKVICVVPDLNKLRSTIIRIFEETLTPAGKLPYLNSADLPYNISAGENFHQIPLIETALNALSLTSAPLVPEKIRALLLSPYINSNPTERCVAALAEQRLSSLAQFNAKTIHYILSDLTTTLYPNATLANRWQAFSEIKHDHEKKSFQYWSQHIRIALQAIGWPGQRPLNSREYQIIERWQQLLQEFSQLDSLIDPANQQEAFKLLNYLCQKIIFQPKVEEKPLQILGLLESVGIPCDALWMMGLDDESWPAKSSPNPFLPIALQRHHQIPHSSAKRELQYAQQLQKTLLNGAKTVVFSYSEQEGDKSLQPSPLIKSIEKANLSLNLEQNWKSAQQEILIDTNAPAVNDSETIHGGSHLLKLQASCPFQAFATIRLGAKKPENASIGLSALERGIICHQALDILWKKLKSQQALLALSEEGENALIFDSVEKSCQLNTQFDNHFTAAEKKYLKKTLKKWLQIEKQRPPFTVLEHETKHAIQINQLALKIQIDRIDELETGEHLIIDYKTGINNKPKKWLEEPLTEPQLPLYSLFGSQKSIAIAYAQINLSNLIFAGISGNDDVFSNIKKLPKEHTWESLNAQWRKNLEKTSDSFMAGNASIDPFEDACDYCELQSLCRIQQVNHED